MTKLSGRCFLTSFGMLFFFACVGDEDFIGKDIGLRTKIMQQNKIIVLNEDKSSQCKYNHNILTVTPNVFRTELHNIDYYYLNM